ISQAAVWKRLASHGGPIPVHGPKNLIDVAEADALWDPTMSSQGASQTRSKTGSGAPLRAAASAAGLVGATTLARARTALLATEVQCKRLLLDQRRGILIDRQTALAKAFAYGRLLRDAWLAWPARVGPQFAATFDRDAATVTVILEQYVRQQLEDLASERM